jgi:hypothetical protein
MSNNLHPLTILPIKKVQKKKEFEIRKPLPEPPFTIVMIAPTKSGKSVTVVNCIKNSMFYKGCFDEIYYISPTVMIDPTLNSIAKDEKIIKIYEEEELEKIDHILSEIVKTQKETKEEERKHILIVLDDMIDYFKKSGKLNNLCAYSRHYKISCLITSQKYNALPKRLRCNASAYLIYHLNNKSDLEDINHEIGSNYPDFLKYYKEATEEPFHFLFIDNREMSLYKNFTDELWTKHKNKNK